MVQAPRQACGVPASPLVMDVLDRVGSWTDVESLARAVDLPPAALDILLDGLSANGLIETEGDVLATGGTGAEATPWQKWSPSAYMFHLGTRDVGFARRDATETAAAPPRPPALLPPRGTGDITLPAPRLVSASLRTALRDRRTHRRFGPGGVSVEELGTLLGLTFGVQAWAHAGEGPLAMKTSPSGGARHSLEAYVWVRRVDALAPGLYHYRPGMHAITRLDDRAAPGAVTTWLPAQSGYEDAAIVVAMSCELARVAWRYRSARAYRVVLIECGHLAQTFCLVATALGLAPFCTAALADTVIEHDLGLDGTNQPAMYVVGAGRPVPGPWQPHAGQPAPRLELTALGKAFGERATRRSDGPRRRRRRASGR
jgi:SagB-type dehydrogenase family enzyme